MSSGRISPRRLLDDNANIMVRQPSEVSPLEITTPRNEAGKDPLNGKRDVKHENPFATPDRQVETLEGKASSQVFVITPPNKGDDDDVIIEMPGKSSKESCSIEKISINELS